MLVASDRQRQEIGKGSAAQCAAGATIAVELVLLDRGVTITGRVTDQPARRSPAGTCTEIPSPTPTRRMAAPARHSRTGGRRLLRAPQSRRRFAFEVKIAPGEFPHPPRERVNTSRRDE
jgi:hypothetical protein